MKNARCIIVAWSTHGVKSGWVIEEAQYGRDREILVPVLIDNVAIPFGFRRIEAAYLVDWNGKKTSPVFQKLVSDISENIGAHQENHHDNKRKDTYVSWWQATVRQHPFVAFGISTAIALAIFLLVAIVIYEFGLLLGIMW